MIFLTVGTHEQQFNRLVSTVDDCVKDGVIKEDVFVQRGYCTYTPAFCRSAPMISYHEMIRNVEQARIVITHGGPGTIMLVRQSGKTPVVVPRRAELNEHVDNHQVGFTEFLQRQGKIVAVYDIKDLKSVLLDYDDIVGRFGTIDGAVGEVNKKVRKFCQGLEDLCIRIIMGKQT